jgi:septal ring factor EnvC (AmiA/AmiB activator)
MVNQNIENMLSQLNRMVSTLQADLQEMKKVQLEIKTEQQDMRKKQKEMKKSIERIEAKAEERHQEVLVRFEKLERDQDFILEKTARNEREIGNIKRLLT